MWPRTMPNFKIYKKYFQDHLVKNSRFELKKDEKHDNKLRENK